MNMPSDPVPGTTPDANPAGIVSVNSRGGGNANPLGKVFFVAGIFGLILVAGFYGYNRYRAALSAQDAAAKQTGKNESKPAQAGIARDFDKEQAAADAAAAPAVPGATALAGNALCADGTAGIDALGPDNHRMLTAQGVALRTCADGHVLVPNIDGSAPIGVAPTQPGVPTPSRYAGDALVAGGTALATIGSDASSQAATARSASLPPASAVSGLPAGLIGGTMPEGTATPGSIGSQLTPSATPRVSAAMLGDRNMILPKGRSIDCGLSMRLVNDLPGLASCVLSHNVYSDNGKVLLLERGSEAVGEYSGAMAQGQKRLFVLWSRIKTPSGVVINLNSPAADDLGTSGLPGIVDNHWWERIGAAFMLSIVEDAIAYQTAKTSGTNGAGGVAVYQSTSQTGNNMAEKVLDSTINIKPTLYKNQGDRSTIYVARDLDFSSVYALRPR